MFEGSLVESRGSERTGTERWTALGSMTVQLAVAGLLIAIPLLRPQVLEMPRVMPPVAMPFLHKPPVVVETRAASPASAMVSLPAAAQQTAATRQLVFQRPGEASGEDAPALPFGTGPGMGDASGAAVLNVGSIGTGPAVVVARPKETGPVHVSTGVSEGLLLAPIEPVYPAIARAVRVQGTVVIEALISKAGRLESVNVVSGPEMLRKAAADAVAAARYRPYLLNGEPTEVRTTYRVVFSLGS
jgi:periplasmic protein TonB